MKTLKILVSTVAVVAICFFSSCKHKSQPVGTNALNNGSAERSLIVIISDIHLGADTSYAECTANRKYLTDFLHQLGTSPSVSELVIAGDLFDEWFVPDTIDTYRGGTQKDFIQRIAATNSTVFDALNAIIKAGNIRVTYVPGNHDLTITEENVAAVLPGIHQARDKDRLGLGSYVPENHSEIVIEHGHRYNIFCAPDPLSNQVEARGTILPPGYFFTRRAAQSHAEGRKPNPDVLPTVTLNAPGSLGQILLYKYWQTWAWAVGFLPTSKHFSEKRIITNVNGFSKVYCMNDILPFQKTKNSMIDVTLYKDMPENWARRCSINHVNVPITAAYALDSANSHFGTDTMSYWQYFNNPQSNKRIVVFGHSHVPLMKSYSIAGKKYVYANSGTWIDHNTLGESCSFVVIAPQNKDHHPFTTVKLYQMDKDQISLMSADSLQM